MDAQRVVPVQGLWLFAAPAALSEPIDKSRIDQAARAFMQRAGAPELAIGIVSPAGETTFFYGVVAKETGAPVDARALFEIGSISKTFTAVLADYAVETKALAWEDSAGLSQN